MFKLVFFDKNNYELDHEGLYVCDEDEIKTKLK